MTKDLVTRIRNVFEDTPQIMAWFDEETYVGAEVRAHISGMWETLKEAADRIEELQKQRVASDKQIKKLEDEIENLEYEMCEMENRS